MPGVKRGRGEDEEVVVIPSKKIKMTLTKSDKRDISKLVVAVVSELSQEGSGLTDPQRAALVQKIIKLPAEPSDQDLEKFLSELNSEVSDIETRLNENLKTMSSVKAALRNNQTILGNIYSNVSRPAKQKIENIIGAIKANQKKIVGGAAAAGLLWLIKTVISHATAEIL